MLQKNTLYYGRDEPLPERVVLRAGPLSLIYQHGDLRYVKLGDREILRRVYVAVRDRNWGTVPLQLSRVQMEVSDDGFRISYDAQHQQGSIDFLWRGRIVGDSQGTITFTMDGVARSTFLRNRIGFCVLHPMQACAGRPCVVEHSNGTVERGVFPTYISPHQPFVDVRAISHEVVPGVQAEVRCEGDVFEMEDQRNWTDASFKTYGTPLALPFPVRVEAGTRISQSVTLTLKGRVPKPQITPGAERATFTVGQAPRQRLPRIGLGVASHGERLTEAEVTRLRALHLSHLRVDLHLSQPDYEPALRQAAAEARALGVSLEIALFLSDASELETLAAALERIKPAVCTWLVFGRQGQRTSAAWIRLAREHLADHDPTARIGGGTNGTFTELNRSRPPARMLDLVSYSLNPQVHAFDNASLVETLETQAVTVKSARQFVGGVPLALSPITLKPRFNPSVSDAHPEAPRGDLPPPVDVRQMSLFGAGWTTGSLKYVSESEVYSATYYETTGWRGVMEMEAGCPLPEAFPSLPGSVFPLYHVLADVGAFAGGRVVPTASSNPLKVDGLAVRKGGRTRVLLANMSPAPQQVAVENVSHPARVAYLDETTVEEAMRSPERFRAREGEPLPISEGALELNLLPYAVARIDSEPQL
jgi:hypothetical protein